MILKALPGVTEMLPKARKYSQAHGKRVQYSKHSLEYTGDTVADIKFRKHRVHWSWCWIFNPKLIDIFMIDGRNPCKSVYIYLSLWFTVYATFESFAHVIENWFSSYTFIAHTTPRPSPRNVNKSGNSLDNFLAINVFFVCACACTIPRSCVFAYTVRMFTLSSPLFHCLIVFFNRRLSFFRCLFCLLCFQRCSVYSHHCPSFSLHSIYCIKFLLFGIRRFVTGRNQNHW